MSIFVDGGGLAFTGGIAGFLVAASGFRRERISVRTKQLESAASLLSRHYECLEKFVADPGAPEPMRDMLLWFSDAAAEPKVAHELSLALCGMSPPQEDLNSDLVRQIEGLGRYRPDLSDLFNNAVSFGIFAMFLRWDETAPLFDQLIAKISATPKQELLLAGRVADTARKFRFNFDHRSGLELAGAA